MISIPKKVKDKLKITIAAFIGTLILIGSAEPIVFTFLKEMTNRFLVFLGFAVTGMLVFLIVLILLLPTWVFDD